MNPTLPHECGQIQDLLGAYALDAVEPEEAALVADHLRSCVRCSQEVDLHRETIALLAAGGGPAPQSVWDRISSSIDADIGPGARADIRPFSPPPPPRLSARKHRSTRWRNSIVAIGAGIAAGLAVVIGIQSQRVDTLSHKVDQLSAAARQSGGFQGLAAALVDPSAHHLTLTSLATTDRPVGQLVILPSGTSYLVGASLPSLRPGRTYQLWSIVDGRAVSVGLLGDHPSTVAFNVDPSVPASAYLVTVEPAGGVVAPTSAPVAKAAV